MDTFKVRAYPADAPDSLEKGHPAAQPLHSNTCHDCSAHSERTRPRRSIVKRHWIAFGIFALTWLVLSCGKHAFYNRPPTHVWGWADEKVEYPPPAGDINQCVGSVDWTYYKHPPWTSEYPYGAETSFTLPLDSDALYLVSRGAFQQGQVNIEQSTQVSDTVDVRVRAAYHHDKVFKHIAVCQMERKDREHGVGIFTPFKAPPHHRHGLEFDVTLTLPAGNKGPLSVKKLETMLPNYNQDIADLGESVLFDKISLVSANGKLSVQSVTSDVGEFTSLNGEIDGHFNARSSLDLHIANGRIAPTVNLLHREGAGPSNLKIHVINGEIDAAVSLTSEAVIGGEFEVDAESKHGKLELKFIDSPVDSVLRCHAGTTVGGVHVELDNAFEGTYSLQSTIGRKSVAQRDVEDPAGKGRRRVVSLKEAPGRVEGELQWVENDGSRSGNEGHVVLQALVSSVELVV